MQKLFGVIALVITFLWGSNLLAQADLPAPEFKSVSVDPQTGHVILKWTNPSDPRITDIEISRQAYTGGNYSFNTIATVGIPTNSFLDNTIGGGSTNINGQTYRIRSSNSTQKSAITSMHLTMALNNSYDACGNVVELNWTPYKQLFIDANGKIVEPTEPENTFNNSILYEVWGYEGSGIFNAALATKLRNVGGQISERISGLNVNSNYFMFVKAILPNGDTVTTYRTELKTTTRREPAVMNIDSVISVNGNIELYFNIDNTTQLDTFALYRSDITSRPIQWYRGTIPTKYVDKDIQLGLTYDYHIGVFRCGQIIKRSDTVNNILIFANGAGRSVNLKWAKFTDEVAIYDIIRTEPQGQLIYSTVDDYEHSDDISALLMNGYFKYCYYVVAKNAKSLARSEIRCTEIAPNVSMPDAIDPLSNIMNPITGISRNQFGPILYFNDDRYRFSLEIFNRAGVRLFRSKKEFKDALSLSHYWNGKYNNDYVKEDVYIYTLKFEFKDSKPFVQNGTVTVVYK